VQDVPKFVLKRLQETTDTESHPDADLLTGFVEQSLLESERARVMEHLARCGACRDVVGFALPASEVAVTTRVNPAGSGWTAWPVLRWGVVAAGIVALTSVGILQYKQRHQKNETLDSVLMARNGRMATPEPAVTPPLASPELHDIRPQTNSGDPAVTRKRVQSNRQDALATRNSTRSLNQMFPAPRSTHTAGSGRGGVGLGSGAELAPNPNVGQQAAAGSSSQTVVVESQAAAAAPAPDTGLSDRLVQVQKEETSKYESTTNVYAVKASPQWSISRDGVLQRSFDAGKTWADVNVDPELATSRSKVAGMAGNTNEVAKAKKSLRAQPNRNVGFRALAAFGSEVWAGGPAAMLYHSGDSGANWARVLPSWAGVTLTGDITSIEFSDPQSGRIATSSGEVWITVDDGQTWGRQ
jgi:hypothetical protein